MHSCRLKLKTNEIVNVIIEFDANKNTYLKFPDGLLGQGSLKTVEKLYAYKTWDEVARSRARSHRRTKASSQHQFNQEIRILKMISELPEDKRIGLVETLSVSKNEVFQRMYDSTLEDFADEIINPPRNEKLKMLLPVAKVSIRQIKSLT